MVIVGQLVWLHADWQSAQAVGVIGSATGLRPSGPDNIRSAG